MTSISRLSRKKTAQQIHVRRRAQQRYDIDLTVEKQKEIVRSIQKGQDLFLRRQSLRITEREVQFEGRTLRVIYDSKRNTLVTCLPLLGEKGEIES